MTDLDAVGRRLLDLLGADGRRPVASLARELNLSRTAVQDRIGRLERDGWIEGYTAITRRPAADGDGSQHALLFLTISTRPCAPVLRAVRALAEFERVWSLAGEIDAIAEVRVADGAALSALNDSISTIDGVGSIGSHTVLSTV